MALGFSIKLTPAQTRLLIALTYPTTWDAWNELRPREDRGRDTFLNTASSLKSRGLIGWSEERTWFVTDEGRSVAALIVGDAKQIVDRVREHESMSKQGKCFEIASLPRQHCRKEPRP